MSERTENHERGDRRDFLGGALLGLAGGSLAASLPGSPARAAEGGGAESGGGKRQGLSPEGAVASAAGYTSGIVVEGKRLIFVSGQGPNDYDADLETQCRQTLENIGKVLAEAGASFEDVAIIRSYFTDISRGLAAYRNVRQDYFVEPYPASTAIGVAGLAFPDLQVEIEAVAVV